MALVYWDTSALVPYYLPEPLSDQVQTRLLKDEPAVSWLVEVEFFSTLTRKVRAGELDRVHAERVASLFLAHLDEGFYHRLPLEALHFRMARDWIGRFDLPLRAPDALHLAVAFTAGLPLVTADQVLAQSAEALGIEAFLFQEQE